MSCKYKEGDIVIINKDYPTQLCTYHRIIKIISIIESEDYKAKTIQVFENDSEKQQLYGIHSWCGPFIEEISCPYTKLMRLIYD